MAKRAEIINNIAEEVNDAIVEQITNEAYDAVLIEDFIKDFNSATTEAGKQKIVKGIMRRKYVPIMEKYLALFAGFNTSNRTENHLLKPNSFVTYLSSIMITLKLYTKLNVNLSAIDAYDALQESGTLKCILNAIDADELAEIAQIQDMIESDANVEMSPQFFVANQVTRLIETITELSKNEQVLNALGNVISAFNDINN